ncbi:unnamed protein product, partial [Porites lobata]
MCVLVQKTTERNTNSFPMTGRQLKTAIHHLENEKGTGAKMCSAIASGII